MHESMKPEKSEWESVPLKTLKQISPYLLMAAIKLKEFYIRSLLSILKGFPF